MQKMTHSQNINIIEVSNVSFGYTDELVLDHVSLNVHKGDYLGIVGPNGGGKSTLLKLMVGLQKPAQGTIKLFGEDITKFKDWSKIGYVSQHVAHIDQNFPMTVEEIVMMGRYPKLGLFGFPTKKDKEAVKEALRQVEMLQYRYRLIGDLSGGQQQRVFIARALAAKPELIVLDEPTVGIDMKTQKQFYALLHKLNTELNITLILVLHELDIISQEATEIAYVNRHLVYHGEPQRFLNSKYFEKLSGKEKVTNA